MHMHYSKHALFCGNCYKEEAGIGKMCYVNNMWRNYQYTMYTMIILGSKGATKVD